MNCRHERQCPGHARQRAEKILPRSRSISRAAVVMPEILIAYETYARWHPTAATRAADARLHVQPAHGRPLSPAAAPPLVPRAARRDRGTGWSVGQGDRYRPALVVASNMLGSSYGSTSPGFLNPSPRALRTCVPRDHPGRHREPSARCSKASVSSIWSRSRRPRSAATRSSSGAYLPDFMDGLVPSKRTQGSGDRPRRRAGGPTRKTRTGTTAVLRQWAASPAC